VNNLEKLKGVRPVEIRDLVPRVNYDFTSNLQESQMKTIESLNKNVEERERNEKEKRESLKRIADNSEDTVKSLKEINELLRQNNRLLEKENERLSESLIGMESTLKNLFEYEKDSGEEQNELLRQATALAVQIDMSINENGKFDWKSLFANTNSTGIFMAIQVYLHSKGLI
jgi:uncharacterized protein YoxC